MNHDDLAATDPHRLRTTGLTDTEHTHYLNWHRHKINVAIAVIAYAHTIEHPAIAAIETGNTRIITHHQACLTLLENPATENDHLTERQNALRKDTR